MQIKYSSTGICRQIKYKIEHPHLWMEQKAAQISGRINSKTSISEMQYLVISQISQCWFQYAATELIIANLMCRKNSGLTSTATTSLLWNKLSIVLGIQSTLSPNNKHIY